MGILETGLKAVVAVKAADVIHKRVLDRQAAHAAEHGQAAPAPQAAAPSAPAAPPPAPATPAPAQAPQAGAAPLDMTEKLQHLQQLGQLKEAGVLSDAEFEEQKARILAS